jgi:S-adenosyl methyltransferase
VAGLPSGSYLMLQDSTLRSKANEEAIEDYNQSGAIPYMLRDPEQIIGFFDGLELVEPGVVPVPRWRPDVAPIAASTEVSAFGGIGRKR